MRSRVAGLGPVLGVALALGVAACSPDRPVMAPETTAPGPEQQVVADVTLPPVPAVPAVGSLAADTDPLTFYVDPVAGSDDNDGQNAARPWASLQYALDQLAPGRTLYLMGGTYRDGIKPGQSHFLLTVDGTPDAWVRVAAAPGQTPVIAADGGNGFEIREADYVEVSGLTVTGEGFGPGNDYGWGILTRSNHHVRITGNIVSGMAVGGIGSVEAANLEIVGNTVYENSFWGPEQGSGISLWKSRDHGTDPAADGYHDRIVGNTVYRNENKVVSEWRDVPVITDGNGIIIDGSDLLGYSGRILVANNLVFDNGGRGILALESSKVDVIHNTTYQNGRTEGLEGGPVELAVGRSHDVQLLNNLAWSRSGAPALIVDEAQNVASGGNVYVTDAPTDARTDSDIIVTGDPGVAYATIDPAVADFRPVAGGVLVGHALPTSPQVVEDAARRPRPGEGADVGAFEQADG